MLLTMKELGIVPALLEDIVLGARSPAHVGAVGGRSTVRNLDVVSRSLVPGNHLLGTGQALGWVIAAVNRSLSLSNRLGGSCAGDMASIVGHVHVRCATAIRDPEPSAVATALWALREILRNFVGSNTLPRSAVIELVSSLSSFAIKDLLLKNWEYHKVLQVHLRDIWVVRDSPCSAGSHSLVLGVHSTVILNAVRRVARARPVLGVILSIGPLSSILSVEWQCGLGLVMSKLNSEWSTCWQSNRGIAWRGVQIAATVGLHPPLLEWQVVERVDRSVGVWIIVIRIRATLHNEIRTCFLEDRHWPGISQTSQYMPLTKAATWALAPEARASAIGTDQSIV
jgi:hypothetical protein